MAHRVGNLAHVFRLSQVLGSERGGQSPKQNGRLRDGFDKLIFGVHDFGKNQTFFSPWGLISVEGGTDWGDMDVRFSLEQSGRVHPGVERVAMEI